MTTAATPQPSSNQAELLRILGIIVVFTGVVGGSWWLARAGWLDSAALFLTAFAVAFGKDRMERGLIKTPDMLGKKVPDTPKEMTGSFKNVRWFALSMYEGAEEWRDKSPNARPFIWCVGVAVIYVAAKLAVVHLLTVVTNPAILMIGGGILLGFLFAPWYFKGLLGRLRAKNDETGITDADDTTAEEA